MLALNPPKDYLQVMGFYVTEPYQMEADVLGRSPQAKDDPLPENCVWGFRDPSAFHARRFPAQAVEPHQEAVTLDSSTVSGVVEWLSNDPIGISGGLNQYVFCNNNPVNFRDPFGRCGRPSNVSETSVNRVDSINIPFVTDSLPDYARSFLGNDTWSVYSFNNRRFRWGAPKCNEFVYDMIIGSGLPNPSVPDGSGGTRPPTANEWGNSGVGIPGWSSPHTPALPGDIVSDGIHVGIQSDNGKRISASSIVNRVVENDWGQGNAGRSPIRP
jgi:hypothetical protein